MAGKPFKSKLLPYRDLIGKLRDDDKSYTEIAEILKKQFGVKTTRHNIFAFVKVRSKHRDVIKMINKSNSSESAQVYPEHDSQDLVGDIKEVKANKQVEKKKILTPEEQEKEEIWESFKAIAEADHTKGLITWTGPKGGAK